LTAVVRSDIRNWEEFISDCYVLLKAMRGPVEALGGVYKTGEKIEDEEEEEEDELEAVSPAPGGQSRGAKLHYRDIIKRVSMDMSIILDNFKLPEGWYVPPAFTIAQNCYTFLTEH
jgi:hypothetical protein